MSKIKILFEKLQGEKVLENWTKVFDNVDGLLDYMNENKNYILGEPYLNQYYSIRIRTFGGKNE